MGNPINLRLPDELQGKLERIAVANNITLVAAIRICLTQGLPSVEKGRIIPSKAPEPVELPLKEEVAA